MAGGELSRPYLVQGRVLLLAAVVYPVAACLETAADRYLQQVERGPRDPLQHGFRAMQGREGVTQPPGVGVQRRSQDRLGRGHLHQLAGVHDADAIAKLDHEREIVSDEEDREVELLFERIDLLQDLPLHHHVQGRGRLVHDKQLGVEDERDGDHQALAHAAGELVRIVEQPARADVDDLEQLLGTLDGLIAGHSRVVGQQHVAELFLHTQHRVERVHGGLEHHRHLLPAVIAQAALAVVQYVFPLEQDLATTDVGGRLVQPGYREGDGGLAAARLAGEAEDFAALDIKADRVDGAHVAALCDVVDAEVSHRQQGLGAHAVFSSVRTGVGAASFFQRASPL
ncbi:putative peptide transport system ATP-binding protein [Aeromonas schubertii]|uniref:Putative peptide transport system ATP-binding protein n=1 Tax=Aeromonas schubertii TaxID=652 RepID=A0A0S2SJQ2_9GAMM|nr:putative peptide transport system ATP-binding protein [Aeromonas schubertii]